MIDFFWCVQMLRIDVDSEWLHSGVTVLTLLSERAYQAVNTETHLSREARLLKKNNKNNKRSFCLNVF